VSIQILCPSLTLKFLNFRYKFFVDTFTEGNHTFLFRLVKYETYLKFVELTLHVQDMRL
jgi:hypothetical protein